MTDTAAEIIARALGHPHPGWQHWLPDASKVIAALTEAGMAIEDNTLRSDYLCLTTDVEVLQARLAKALEASQ